MSKQDKALVELRKLLDLFESGDVPEAVAKVLLPARDVPCAKWSLGNRLLCLMVGTDDARGYRQWEEAGRHVKKGARCFRILAPRFVKKTKDKDGNALAEPKMVLVGFTAVPVFRDKDTEGEPLERPEYRAPELPPLWDVAERFGVKVEYLGPGMDSSYYGYYRPDRPPLAPWGRPQPPPLYPGRRSDASPPRPADRPSGRSKPCRAGGCLAAWLPL